MEEQNRQKSYHFAVLCVCAAVIFMMIKNPEGVSNAAREGIDLCVSTMIPTLFPFLFVTAFLLRSGTIDFIGSKMSRFASLFKLSGNALGVFLISLFSGFPVGASMISTMLDERKITKSEAARLMSCCVNAGPAFVISAVGAGMYRSRRAGIILFISLTISALTVFILTGFIMKNETSCEKKVKVTPSFSSSLVDGVADATKSTVSVCGWIIVFSCIGFFLAERAGGVMMFFEVSLGCKIASDYPLPIAALVIGWSGLCVHCQVFHAVIKSQMKKRLFFFFRLLNGALSAGICQGILHFFPCTVQTFASSSETVGAGMSSNAVACAGLLMMCAILILDFEESRTQEGQTFVKNQKTKKPEILRKKEKR